MDRNSLEYQLMRDKALAQLRSGESLTGKDGAWKPVSCHRVIPVGNFNGWASIIFLSRTRPSRVLDSHKMRLSGVQSKSFFTL